MSCIPAPVCKKALADASLKWPDRNRLSDGICPSPEHSRQNPKSDHERGQAFDLTHDPKSGPDCDVIASQLTASGDPRIKYIIWERRIWFPTAGKYAKGWSKYGGKNPHEKHLHVSIKADARNDLRPWPWSTAGGQPARGTLRRGSEGQEVRLLQERLQIEIDGQFGRDTEKALKAFQKRNGLTEDGIAGPKVWAALELK